MKMNEFVSCMATSWYNGTVYVSGAPEVFRGNESRIYDHVSDQAYKVIGPYALQPFVNRWRSTSRPEESKHLNRHTVGDDPK
jgi:hypothetical protein